MVSCGHGAVCGFFSVISVLSGSRLHLKKWLVVGYGCCLCCGGLLMSSWLRVVSNLFFVVVDDKSIVCFKEEKGVFGCVCYSYFG